MRTVAALQKELNCSSAPLTFMAALNDCITATPVSHPILARNVGLVPAWQGWAAWRESAYDNRSIADRIIANPRNNFNKCVEVVKDVMRTDPIWDQGIFPTPSEKHLDISAVFAVAPLMYWRRPHVLIELTPALEQLLDRSDLGDDIPTDLLRPPMPSCYIKFSEAMQRAIMPPPSEDFICNRVEGVYVFESVREEQRAVALVAICGFSDNPKLGAGTIDMIISDEQRPLNDLIQGICSKLADDQEGARQFAMAQLCTKIFLYWNVERARQEAQTPYSDALIQLKGRGPKKAAKLRRQMDKLYDRILLGPLILPSHLYGQHGEVSPHWRRGHFRMQPHGPQRSLRKVLFIAPTLIRADRLEDGADLLRRS